MTMKSLYSDHYQKLTVQITLEEREQAKKLAKSKGMSFMGWLGQLVKNELATSTAETTSHPSSDSEEIRDGLPG